MGLPPCVRLQRRRRRHALRSIPARPLTAGLGLLALLAAQAGPAAAQTTLYKIVEPDGRITYTDRPVRNNTGKVSPVGANGAAGSPIDESLALLPTPLRTVATRFPITLFTAPDCVPCDRGREFLRQRGVPYRERQATTDADREVWQRVVGAPEAPALGIGSQMLRGYAPDSWGEYLDAAGYPRDNRLPPNYQPPAPGPVAEGRSAPPADGRGGSAAAEGRGASAPGDNTARPAVPTGPAPAATDTGVPVPAIRF